MNWEVLYLFKPNVRTNFFCRESITKLEAKIWNMVPEDINTSELLNVFKYEIKVLARCKTYINQVGFTYCIFLLDWIHHMFICFSAVSKILMIMFETIIKICNPFLAIFCLLCHKMYSAITRPLFFIAAAIKPN